MNNIVLHKLRHCHKLHYINFAVMVVSHPHTAANMCYQGEHQAAKAQLVAFVIVTVDCLKSRLSI